MPANEPTSRIESVDFLRGAVMVLMALDHVRHFFSDSWSFRPTDLDQTSAALFLTRWVTHFCAPVFVLLAGAGVFLSTTGPRGKPKGALFWFLLTRGAWLVFLELTFVRCLGWTFNVDYHYVMGGVIWALGWSMIALAALIHLPRAAIVSFGVVMIAAHNAFDALKPSSFGSFGWLWKVLHTSGQLKPFSGVDFKVAYPLVPWIGVMAVGYGFGALLLHGPEACRRIILRLGVALTAAFVVLRFANVYGDTHAWSAQPTALFTLFSFINCEKYPPSLLFLLMTLGPALSVLAVSDSFPRALTQPLVTFGRVPLFYYLLHLPLIHLLAVVFAYVRYGHAHFLFENPPSAHGARFPLPDGYGYPLPVVYAVWAGVVLIHYPACRWFAGIKQRHRNRWLSYL